MARADYFPLAPLSISCCKGVYHYSDIFHLRSFVRAIKLKGAIEWRWVGDTRAAGDSWTNDHFRGGSSRAAARGGATRSESLGFGSDLVPAVAVARGQRALEDPLGTGGSERVGVPELDRFAAALACERPPESARCRSGPTQRPGREDSGRSTRCVSSTSLGAGEQRGPTAAVAPIAGRMSIT